MSAPRMDGGVRATGCDPQWHAEVEREAGYPIDWRLYHGLYPACGYDRPHECPIGMRCDDQDCPKKRGDRA